MVATLKKTGTGYIVELPDEVGEALAKSPTGEVDVEVRGEVVELRRHVESDHPVSEEQYRILSDRMHARYAEAFRKLA
jgi:hypothetical protein